ncbi:MAG: hypothetical protein HQ581_12860, partial [Planctomycetes bacterium]|nr:hypothetical protein [Planctomycetota bacterium]
MSSLLVYRGGALPASKPERLLGGKAAHLIQLRQVKQPVPPFYVITTDAFQLALHSTGLAQRIDRRLDLACADGEDALRETSADIRSWIQQVAPPKELEEAIRNAHEAAMPAEAFLAVRSSVVGEDA